VAAVELEALEVGVFLAVGTTDGALEVGATEVGATDGALEVGATEVGTTEVEASEVGATGETTVPDGVEVT
jgi:hypothetical protein